MLYGKEGFGFWDVTTFPVGGDFKRFRAIEPISELEPMPSPYKGATHYGKIERDGKTRKIAFNLELATESR